MPDTPASPRRLERDVQADICRTISLVGYEYLETGVARRATECPNCHERFTPHDGNSNAPGVPDLLVWRSGWGCGIMATLEVKGATTRLSKRQKELYAADRIYIVRSPLDALNALLRVECAIQGAPLQRERLAKVIAQLSDGKAVSRA